MIFIHTQEKNMRSRRGVGNRTTSGGASGGGASGGAAAGAGASAGASASASAGAGASASASASAGASAGASASDGAILVERMFYLIAKDSVVEWVSGKHFMLQTMQDIQCDDVCSHGEVPECLLKNGLSGWPWVVQALTRRSVGGLMLACGEETSTTKAVGLVCFFLCFFFLCGEGGPNQQALHFHQVFFVVTENGQRRNSTALTTNMCTPSL
jgi:hypothetical protein